jgi:hypothetical protein
LPQELYQELISRLARLRRRQESIVLWSGVFNGLTALTIVTLIAIVTEMLGHFPISGRTWMFWTALAVGVAGFLGFALPSLLVRLGIRPRTSDDALAFAVGEHYPKISDRLVNTLQLARPLFHITEGGVSSMGSYGSPTLALAAFEHTYGITREVDFNAIVDDRPLKRSALLFFFSLALGAVLFLSMGSEMMAATGRLVHYGTFYQKPAPFTFIIKPGDARVMRGDSVRLWIVTRGEQLPQIMFRFREEGQKDFDAVSLQHIPLDSSFVRQGFRSGFTYLIRAEHPTEYYAEAREIESDRFKISVLDHPIVRSLNVEVSPPAYTRQKPVVLSENIGDIAGVTGTRGTFRVVASTKLQKATVVFTPLDSNRTNLSDRIKGNSKTFPLSIQDSIATGSIAFMSSGSYHVELLDRDSIANEHPIEYTVTITKDEPPQIVLLQPNGKTDLPSNMRLDMLARIHDDFGFRGVRIGYRLSKSKYVRPDSVFKWETVPLSNYNIQDLDVPYIWNLTSLGIGPEDEITYIMEVTDNDAVTGPKSARTPEYVVRVPSVEEIFKRADEEADKAKQDMNEIQQDAKELQKKVDEAAKEMEQMKPSDLAKGMQDFSKQQDVQQMVSRQKNLSDRLDQVSKDLQEMTKQMEQQNVLSPETLQKYQELQDLFKQINSPELKKAMEQLQQAMQKNADPKQLQDAMKNMKLNEDQFRKSIERTENILKKIQAEQKVDELMKSATELAKQEQKAADDARQNLNQGKPMTADEKAAAERKQQDAQKELERMQQEAKQLASDMQKLPEPMQAPDQMKSAQDALNDPSTQSAMQNSSSAMKQGDQQRGAQSAQDASNKMKNAADKLRDLKRQLSENERQRTMREMKQIQEELNRESKGEEQIKNQAQQAAQNSNVFRDLAEQQSQEKDQLGQTASKAMQLAQKSTSVTPEMGNQMGKAFSDMQKAQDAMTDRNQSGSQQNAQSAMTALNKASQAMQKAMQQMASQSGKSGGSGGEGEEGQSGEGEGQGENGQTPGSSGQGGSALQQFIDQINKMAAQQQALNDQMQSMASGQGGGQAAQKELMRQQAAMSKLVAQQQAMQKSLEQMAKEQQGAKLGTKSAADDLQKIADDMQKSIDDMRSSGVKPETVQRQERILLRMLSAEQSVHERDKDEQRESKPGEDVVRPSPRELDIQSPTSQKELQDEISHSRETGYTADYNTLIRKYFESLEKK